jgi:hypothetical protein
MSIHKVRQYPSILASPENILKWSHLACKTGAGYPFDIGVFAGVDEELDDCAGIEDAFCVEGSKVEERAELGDCEEMGVGVGIEALLRSLVCKVFGKWPCHHSEKN